MRSYAVVLQHVIGVVCVLFAVLSAKLCGGVAACHRYVMCTVGCVECGSHLAQRTVHIPYL